MTDDASPIAYTALTAGTPVQTADGDQFGVVESVLAVSDLDVFDGITVRTDAGLRFCDADCVGAITTAYVRTTVSADQVQSLPEPEAAARAIGSIPTDDSGSSLGDRFGRLFGKGKWKQEK